MNTTDGAAPLLTIELRDGTTLSISPDAVRTGVETVALDRVQDARQIAPDPPTFALRIAGRRLVEFQPAQPADGALALEAVYRLRPELRPAGFEPPANVPAWWPSASRGATPQSPSWPSNAQASASGVGMSDAAGAPPSYDAIDDARAAASGEGYTAGDQFASRAPARPDGRLTPYPRDLLSLVAAPFRLFLAHWRAWLTLGLIVAAPPALVSGALQMAFYAARGHNPWRAIDTVKLGLWPTTPPRPPQVAQLALLLAMAVIVTAVGAVWQIAVFSPAGRDALLGRPLDLRASLESGRRRFVPALLVSLAVFGGPLVAMGVPLALAAAVAPTIAGSNPNATPTVAVLAAALLGCLSLVLFVALGVAGVYALARLFIAPYLAATQPLDVRAALVESWRLTGGRGRWWQAPCWRALAAVAIVGLLEALVTAPLGNVELLSYGLASLVVSPLSVCVTGPLTSLAFVAALYDLRLRADGGGAAAEATHHKPST